MRARLLLSVTTLRSRAAHTAKAARDRGSSAVEYGLMVAAVAAVIVGAVFGFGRVVAQTFDNTCAELTERSQTVCAPPPPPAPPALPDPDGAGDPDTGPLDPLS